MKSVLISIQPKWCELIASGKKMIEVRKSAPKEVPFKVYMYQTKKRWIYKLLPWLKERQAKVIGEFICDKIDRYPYGDMAFPTPAYDGDPTCCECGNGYFITCGELEKTCLEYKDLENYGNGKTLYGWHISDLKIYDKPKELGEFYYRLPEKVLEKGDYDCRKPWDCCCGDFPEGSDLCENCIFGGRVQLTRAPQSWQYVEGIE